MSHQSKLTVHAGLYMRTEGRTLNCTQESQSLAEKGRRGVVPGAAPPPDDRIRRCVTPSSKNPTTRRASFGINVVSEQVHSTLSVDLLML